MTLSTHHRWLLAAVIALMTLAAARAQEPPPGAEEAPEAKTYHDLRRSKDRVARFAANHYFTLVSLQEWSDATGKSKVMAKYVEHDPDLAWVKLQAVRTQDGKRTVKEMTVPVEKLSKTCQSRVRQIDKLKEKLDALLAADDDPQTSGDAAGAPLEDPGAPMVDERGTEPGQPIQNPQPSTVEQSPAPTEFEVDPLGFAEMDLSSTPAPVGPEGGDRPGAPFGPTGLLPASGSTTPNGSGHPTNAEELKAAFTKAFQAGDKEALEKLVYWGDSSEPNRRITRSMLMDDAGKAKILEIRIGGMPDQVDSTDHKWTIESAQFFDVEYETDRAGHNFNLPFGEIEGKYYLGAWDADQPAVPSER